MYKYSIWFSDFNNISGHYFVFEGKLVNFLTKQTNNVYVTTAKERSLNHLLPLRPPQQCVPAAGTRVCRVFKEQATATKNRPPNASHLFSDSDLFMYPSLTGSLSVQLKTLHPGLILLLLHHTTWCTIKTPLFTEWQIAAEGDAVHPDYNV